MTARLLVQVVSVVITQVFGGYTHGACRYMICKILITSYNQLPHFTLSCG
eukprot:m.390725 g.390725  ORF g.390725 m.390725 type:complete len:50 (-) comp209477_c0_seq1:32-181(-)